MNVVIKIVSIIMPAYNAEKTIASSIGSVICQTYNNWELIIINDASSDSTAQIVCAFMENEPRIRLFTNEENLGIAKSRNFGVLQAAGEWIAFLDSDDSWHKSKLQNQLCFSAETSARITYTATAYINESGVRSGYVLRAKPKLTFNNLLKANLMSCSSVMVSKDLMLRYPFPEGFLHEDYVVWLQILKEVKYACGLDKPLLLYRVWHGSKSGKRMKSAKMTFHAYRKVNYSKFSAFLLTVRYGVRSVLKRIIIRISSKNIHS